jgi:hypothetical protein
MRAFNIETDAQHDRHLSKRCQQRGVDRREFAILFNFADQLVPVGGGRTAMTLSRSAVVALKAEGISIHGLDRARRRAIVINADGKPVTILIPSGQGGRRYRHGLIGSRRARR